MGRHSAPKPPRQSDSSPPTPPPALPALPALPAPDVDVTSASKTEPDPPVATEFQARAGALLDSLGAIAELEASLSDEDKYAVQVHLRYEGRDLGELFGKVEPGTFPIYDVTPEGWVQMMSDARGVTRLYVVPEKSLLEAATDGALAIYRPVDRKALRIHWTPTREKEKSDG